MGALRYSMAATIIVPAQTLVLQRCCRAAGLEARFSPPSSIDIVRSEWPLWGGGFNRSLQHTQRTSPLGSNRARSFWGVR